MEILNRSIRIIDYENHGISSRETPARFDEYVVGLINHIITNDSTREYKTRTVVVMQQEKCLSTSHLKDLELLCVKRNIFLCDL